MRNLRKITSLMAMASIVVSTSSAYANAGYITLKGYTEDTKSVTALMLKKESNIKTLKSDDILYISQEKVIDNVFSVTLPLLDKSEYDMYSNVLNDSYLEKDKTIYLSQSGDDNNTGESEEEALKTFEAAYEKLYYAKEIVLLDDYTFEEVPEKYGYDGELTIRGDVATRKLNIPTDSQAINMNCNLTIDNCVIGGTGRIYANGYKLLIKDSVTCENRISVFGGGVTKNIIGDTTLEIYGGQYDRIYGGSINKTVYGDTYITVGGNVNPDENVNDNVTECYIYGGGYNGPVTGTTHVTFGGNAKSDYVMGAGESDNGTASKTEVYITGGRAMNVYGGAKNSTLVNCDTHITMTAGKVEALFGGSFYAGMSGNTCVDMFGGEVTRRIYTGSYNNLRDDATWASDYYVNGTTTLRLKPGVAVVTKRDANRGLFCGSRVGTKHQDEKNFLIYLDGCENEYKNYMGEQGGIYASYLKNYVDYTVSASVGGEVYTVGENTVFIKPEVNYYGTIGETKYIDQEAVLTSATTTVNFYRQSIDDIVSAVGTVTDTGLSADVKYTMSDIQSDIYVALYDGERMISCTVADSVTGNGEITADFKESLVAGKEYTVLVMMWNKGDEPLTSKYKLVIKK